jgi:hypothetical protein
MTSRKVPVTQPIKEIKQHLFQPPIAQPMGILNIVLNESMLIRLANNHVANSIRP